MQRAGTYVNATIFCERKERTELQICFLQAVKSETESAQAVGRLPSISPQLAANRHPEGIAVGVGLICLV